MSLLIRRLIISAFAILLLPTAVTATPPFSIEEMLSPPYPFGVSARSPVIADDGSIVACLWSDTGYGNRDVWTFDIATGEWVHHTDCWTQKEARLRREFERDLNHDRAAWEEEHADPEDADGADDTATDAEITSGDAEAFDEEERVEEFEEDLLEQREKFSGVASVAFLNGGHELLWVFEGRIHTKDLDTPAAEPVLRLNHEDGFQVAEILPDCDALLLQSDSDLYLWWSATGNLQALTKGGYGDRANNGAAALSRDRRWLAVVIRDYTSVRRTQIPELLADDPHTTSHHHVRPADTPETVTLKLFDLSATPPWPVEVELPVEPFYHTEYMDWSPQAGNARLLIGTISGDTQYYRAYLITPPENDIDDPGIELAYEEYDECWVNWARTRVAWTNDAGLVLQSEKDGTAGLYELVEKPQDSSGEKGKAGETEPATTGDDDELQPTHEPQPLYVTDRELIQILPFEHSRRVLLHHRDPDHTAASVGIFDLDARQYQPLLKGPAWYDPQGMNELETKLVYQVKDERRFSRLGLVDVPAVGDHEYYLNGEIILDREAPEWNTWADTWDVRFSEVPLQDFPEYERIFRNEDNLSEGNIPVKLWLPPDWSPENTYPLLIWIHGAGYSSTVTRDPGFYTLFHPFAAEQLGWIVAEVEYRGSKGLGRDWRVDVWGRLGHPETDDLIAVKRHLVAEYGADPERTALWGWSYGGFQTLMAMGLAPEEFPVGCAVAPVNQWENYNYWYSTGRLGHPDDNEDEYERSAAETYLEYITGDLLILHGLRDDNTLFQSIAQYLEKSHELGINVELKLFPSDSHGISNEQHYVRIFDAIIDYCEAHWPTG